MNEYMLLYRGGDPDWQEKADEETIKKGMSEWNDWMVALDEKESLVTGGSPLHYAGKRLTKDNVVTDISASELKELVSGYSIIKAENMEQALEIAKSCPIFNYPDIVVEVREVVQLG